MLFIRKAENNQQKITIFIMRKPFREKFNKFEDEFLLVEKQEKTQAIYKDNKSSKNNTKVQKLNKLHYNELKNHN